MLLLGAAVLAPVAAIAALAGGAGVPLLAISAAAAAIAWTIADIRAGFLIAVLLATFVDYSSGRLTLQMTIVCASLTWLLLLLLWRSAWVRWTLPSAGVTRAIAVWLLVLGFGAAAGLVRGHGLREIGVELAAALWPLLTIVAMQVYRRPSLAWAGWGIVAVALVHVVFGLTMLQVYQRRIGGIYFMTTTGMVAVGLWTFALLAPSRKLRAVCLVAMIPMLAHLLLSFTRGYWFGAVAGLAAATFLAWRSLGRFERAVRARRLLLLPALAAIVLATAGLSTLYFGSDRVLSAAGSRFGSSFSTETTGETLSNVIRLLEYERAVQGALESPVVGQGLGYSFVTRDPITRDARSQWYVHNYYLLIWLKLGIVGLAAFAWLIASLVRSGARTARDDPSWAARAWAIATVAVTCQVLVILITNFSLADVNTAFVLAYLWGVHESSRVAG